jgi:Na+/proline symporter
MLASPDVMRALLVVCALGMALLAVFFLRKRELTISKYIGWGLLIVLLPLLGPFLVILFRPGKR